jgi:predicted RecA/RadA family phage recombinase
MAKNEHLRHADHVSLPVPAGTASGDPVKVGVLNGVAQTDRATASNPGGGNPDGHASVWLDGSHHFPVTGAVDAVGQAIYIADGALTATAEGGTLFGAALETQAGDGTIPVKIIQAGA